MRDTVFISHATPEDNDFVRWLGARLIGHGYKVWADVFDLKGGSPFWKAIEENLRLEAAKFIFVVSKFSIDPSRSGVRNELSVADSLKKLLADERFIIPVRVDDAPFSDFPIQIHQLNAIDFSLGWGGRLLDLMEVLEADSVPRDPNGVDERMAEWRGGIEKQKTVVEEAAEPLLTNLIEISQLPSEITFFEYEGRNDQIRSTMDKTGVPYYLFHRFVISFADQSEIQSVLPPEFSVRASRHVPLDEFLGGHIDGITSPQRSEARRILTFLLRRNVEDYLMRRGLRKYEASGAPAFYFPVGVVSDGKVFYQAGSGKRTWKAVIGRSVRNDVFWHLAMKVNIDLGTPAFVRFKPYICFSRDGQTAIEDAKLTSAIRRRFCKNWWNPQWRQLQQAFVAFLSDQSDKIEIDLRGRESLLLAGSLRQLIGVRRMPEDFEFSESPDEPPELVDQEDDEFDIDEPEDADDE